MDDPGLIMLLAILITAVVFDYINGFHDTANAIATVVSTRVLSPFAAVLMAAFFNFVGALTGTSVAKTVGRDILDPTNSTQFIVLASLLAAIVWNLVTWYFGLPSSSSHALIGGLIGAGLAGNGFNLAVIKGDGVWKVIVGLVTSPIMGFIIGYLVMVLLSWLLVRATPHFVNRWFRRLQLFSAAFMAYSHGGNDAQKTMGIMALAVLTYESHGNVNSNASFNIPIWIILLAATAMALGTATGGWRIIRTMGSKIIDLVPIQGFAAETSAATVIETASRLGLPVSTTHVISASIMGVGASGRISAVRWSMVGSIVRAWVLTLPVCIALGILFELLMLVL
ncbi:MAG TPA: inorganic phosphate transporter [Chloroflexia bacterium]|nr:inorganic phosphate transporter [Chloroflexia bacterium]